LADDEHEWASAPLAFSAPLEALRLAGADFAHAALAALWVIAALPAGGQLLRGARQGQTPGSPGLAEYMGLTGLGIASGSGFRTLTNAEFVREWAQQYGASHEAWKVTEHFLNAKHSCVFIGGMTANARVLATITNTVLCVADQFFNRVIAELIEQGEVGRASYRQAAGERPHADDRAVGAAIPDQVRHRD
jgi:hypothetical protein